MKRSKRTNSSTNSSVTRRPPSVASARQLGELQALMAGAIMRPLTARNRMQPRAASGQPMARVAASFIKPNDRLTSFERLEIYNRQYWWRILDCFYDDYPGLRAVIGDRKFDRLAHAYLERHPSESFTLRNLGRRLERFLRAEPKWIAPHQRLALDMVRLEWANIVAFDEAAKPAIHVDDLLGRKPSKVRLGLQPYITLLEVRYPVDDLLIAAKTGDDRLRGEASNAVELHHRRAVRIHIRRLKPQRLYIAAHRMNCAVYYKPLSREQYEVLRELQRGATLEKACAVLLKRRGRAGEDPAARVQRWFQEWTSFGWFCQR
ncbi:MAG TPA: DNA-binding domain-containing protein [Verrucomicrobiae bacterium]|nr:DNA-binding domain-containing protein [Verrucomicrobiae bacterium]